jgi:hypothetical protein
MHIQPRRPDTISGCAIFQGDKRVLEKFTIATFANSVGQTFRIDAEGRSVSIEARVRAGSLHGACDSGPLQCFNSVR